MTEPLIRPMSAADLGPAAELILQGGNDRSVFLRWAMDYEPSQMFVAEDSGRIIGTGIATVHGAIGWVGAIFVDSDRRREGLGERLTRTVIDDLERRRCRTLVLIASEAGRPLYERLGFDIQMRQVWFTAPGLPATTDEDRVRPFEPAMLREVIALDRRATGEDRSTLIRLLATPDSARIVVGANGAIAGFLIRAPWGGAAVVAPEADDAIRLLDWRRRQAGTDHAVHAGIPEGDDHRGKRLLSEGWAAGGAGTRMIRGAPLDWRPNWVWGHYSGAFG
jgi:predicted N-acetyltransferase YhbS